MPSPHPDALRERVVAAYEAGEGSYKEIAERFSVGEASVSRWLRLARENGSVAPSPMGGSRRPFVVGPEHEGTLRELIDCNLDCTLKELSEAFKAATGITVSQQTMSDTVRRLGYTRKRGLSAGWRRPGRTS